MSELDPIIINIPCPTKEEGIRLCTEMLKQELCGTTKIQEGVHLMYVEEGVQGSDIVLLSIKTTKINLEKIHESILKNHSWGTLCIEALPMMVDMC